jgi:hypothetical protein
MANQWHADVHNPMVRNLPTRASVPSYHVTLQNQNIEKTRAAVATNENDSGASYGV